MINCAHELMLVLLPHTSFYFIRKPISLIFSKDIYSYGFMSKIYFAYSLNVLIVKTLLMLWTAGSIHTASQEPLHYIRNTPTSDLCSEVSVMRQITTHLQIVFESESIYLYERLKGLPIIFRGSLLSPSRAWDFFFWPES